MISIDWIEARYPNADAEWLRADYCDYCRWFDEDDDGTSEERMMTFDTWLDAQTADYRAFHG